MNDGYVYRLRYNETETDGDTTTLVSVYDTEFYDMTLNDMLSVARNLVADNRYVTLTRRLIVRQPPWEKIELDVQ